MGILQSEVEGYEADDIIGTLSRLGTSFKDKGEGNQLEVIILTGDQDTMQLVDEHVSILTPPKGKLPAKMYGVDEVLEKYGVTPSQIVDYKALIGDVSDNIPGVAGIGPKTAANLLKTFGTLERIYLDIKEVQLHYGEIVAKRLMDGRESAYLSQDLSKIVTDIPLPIKLNEMEYVDIKKELLKNTLEDLGFKSLVRRIWGDEEKTIKSKISDNQMGLF